MKQLVRESDAIDDGSDEVGVNGNVPNMSNCFVFSSVPHEQYKKTDTTWWSKIETSDGYRQLEKIRQGILQFFACWCVQQFASLCPLSFVLNNSDTRYGRSEGFEVNGQNKGDVSKVKDRSCGSD